MQPKKSIFKSKTFWFNVLAIASAATGVLTPFASPAVIGITTGIINVILRGVTDQPVGVTGN